MNKPAITYPLYRKYSNNKSLFKINSPTQFEEIQILGAKKVFHSFTAKILPDRNFIHDLIFDYEKHWVLCNQQEYEDLKNDV